MPYKKIEELPKPIIHVLPEHGQLIYLKAFNNALKEYGSEATAIKVAWSAVKKVYKKDTKSGKWIKKTSN